ncbi:MAG: hypothetical protein HY287_05835, partial [Planctomycetes bacterium]|nr:hypothetical protein [Planctomycetota bacterium]
MRGTPGENCIFKPATCNSHGMRRSMVAAMFAVFCTVSTALAAKPIITSERFTLSATNPVATGQIDPISSIDRTPHGGVAGTPPGTNVYRNENNTLAIYRPGANQRMADDMQLVGGAANLVYYELLVAGNASNGSAFNTHVELWTGDPCLGTSTLIQGTQIDFTNIPNNLTAQNLEAFIDPPVAIPGSVWMAVTFSGAGAANAGWIVGEQAETGSTADLFSQNAPAPTGCSLFSLTGHYSGFWANINVQLVQPPVGACCSGSNCTQTTEAACTGGVWQGAFTTCDPNVCQAGACCSGTTFNTCADSNEAACRGTVFHPADSCGASACGPNFKIYEDDFVTAVIVPVAQGQKWADDLTFGPGAPCELLAYDVV